MKFAFDDSTDYNVCGVYFYRIGDYAYFGRSKNVEKRLRKHESGINSAINNYHLISNNLLKESVKSRHMAYFKQAKYLLENPKIEFCPAILIFSSTSLKEVCIFEHRTLRLYAKSKWLFNRTYYASILKDDVTVEPEPPPKPKATAKRVKKKLSTRPSKLPMPELLKLLKRIRE